MIKGSIHGCSNIYIYAPNGTIVYSDLKSREEIGGILQSFFRMKELCHCVGTNGEGRLLFFHVNGGGDWSTCSELRGKKTIFSIKYKGLVYVSFRRIPRQYIKEFSVFDTAKLIMNLSTNF